MSLVSSFGVFCISWANRSYNSIHTTINFYFTTLDNIQGKSFHDSCNQGNLQVINYYWASEWRTCLYRHQEFQFLLLDAVHCGTESELQVLNDSHIFVSFSGILLLFGTKFQYSHKRRRDAERKQSHKAAIRDLVLTFCPTMHSVQQRKLKLLMLVL